MGMLRVTVMPKLAATLICGDDTRSRAGLPLQSHVIHRGQFAGISSDGMQLRDGLQVIGPAFLVSVSPHGKVEVTAVVHTSLQGCHFDTNTFLSGCIPRSWELGHCYREWGQVRI